MSSKKQASEDRKSLPYQKQVITEAVAAAGGELVDILVFSESGHKGKWRDELAKILTIAKARGATTVITSELDRLARRSHWQGSFVEDLDRAGMRYRAVLDDLDTSRESDRIKLLALGMVSEIFIIGLRRKVKGSTRLAMAEGRLNPSRPAYGYRRNGKLWEADPATAEWVERIFSWRADGYGPGEIAAMLRGAGAPPPSRSRVWGAWMVRKMLARQSYTGLLSWGDLVVADALPALVSKELWQAAQVVNKRKFRARVAPKHLWLLTGLVKASCGCNMTGMGTGTRGVLVRQYQSRDACKAKGHRITYVSADWLERQVLECVGQMIQSGALPKTATATRVAAVTERDVAHLSKAAEEKWNRLDDALIAGRIVGERYDIIRRELSAERQRLNALAAEVSGRRTNAPTDNEVAIAAEGLRRRWQDLILTDPSANPDQWKVFLRQVVDRVVVGHSTGGKIDNRNVEVHLRL